MISQREIVNMKLVIRWGCQASKQDPPSPQDPTVVATASTSLSHLCTMYTVYYTVYNVHCEERGKVKLYHNNKYQESTVVALLLRS